MKKKILCFTIVLVMVLSMTGNAFAATYGYLSVPYFKQEKSYFCGPATTKQTIHYIKGASASQTTIANAVGTTSNTGTDLLDMQTYINNNQNRRNYIIVTAPTETQIKNIVKYSVSIYAPTVLRLRFTKGGNWPYSVSKHYMNASGYYNDGGVIQVTDPYLGWVKTTSDGIYYVTSYELYNATNNHPDQNIMY